MKEENIKERKKLKGYEVVRYNNGYRLSVGNSQVFPIRKAAETYKRNYESYPWFKDDAIIEEVEYEGVPMEDFINMLSSAWMAYDCVWIGEPSTDRMDEDQIVQATYDTFQKIDDGIWEYRGDCFKGERFRHGVDVPYV